MENFILRTIGIYLNAIARLSYKLAGKHGAFLFCMTQRKKMAEKHIDFLNNAAYKTLDVNGDSIKMFKWGSGPKKMLLVHGWSSHSFRWKRYIDQFDLEEFTIYAFDNPGHGLSSGNQFNLPKMGILLDLILKDIGPIDIMMGHSIGAFSCLFVLHQYKGHRVDKLILLASPGKVTDWIDQYKVKMKLGSRAELSIIDHFMTQYGFHLEYFVASDFASSLSMDGLIIHDKDDRDTPAQYAKEIHAAWAQSQLVITEGNGHKLNQQEVIDVIKNYISSEALV